MHISSFGVIVSIIAYFLFPQHAFAQTPKENNKIVFKTQNETISPEGFSVNSKENTSGIIQVAQSPVIYNGAILTHNDPVTMVTPVEVKKKPVPKGNIYIPPKTTGPTVINPGKEYQVVATAYSSTVDQTDSSPFITASGTHVHDGTLAANFLKFGTKVTIPDFYGDKIFTVEDRMRDSYKVDVWFPSREQALKFGVKRTRIIVID